MTPEQARIVLLEDALIQACHTVSFLHGCLTSDRFKYSYPEQTAAHLQEWKALVTIPSGCHHSRFHENCEACKDHAKRRAALEEANKVLSKSPT